MAFVNICIVARPRLQVYYGHCWSTHGPNDPGGATEYLSHFKGFSAQASFSAKHGFKGYFIKEAEYRCSVIEAHSVV